MMLRCWKCEWTKALWRAEQLQRTQARHRQEAQLVGKVISQIVKGLCWWQWDYQQHHHKHTNTCAQQKGLPVSEWFSGTFSVWICIWKRRGWVYRGVVFLFFCLCFVCVCVCVSVCVCVCVCACVRVCVRGRRGGRVLLQREQWKAIKTLWVASVHG